MLRDACFPLLLSARARSAARAEGGRKLREVWLSYKAIGARSPARAANDALRLLFVGLGKASEVYLPWQWMSLGFSPTAAESQQMARAGPAKEDEAVRGPFSIWNNRLRGRHQLF